MPYLKEHAVRLKSPDKYERFRRENDKFGDGIDAIWGITDDGEVELQALRFDAKRYSLDDVQEWLKRHDYKPLELEPATGEFSTDTIERDALLMEAGEYPDKEMIVSETTLRDMAESGVGAPVIVEHRPTLILGWVKELYRKGKQLWGRLMLKPHANQLIEESGVKGLSVGLIKQPNGRVRLREVSLTLTPRVETAQLFTDGTPSLYMIQEAQMSEQQTTEQQTTEHDTREQLLQERALRQQLEAKVEQLTMQVQFARRQLLQRACQTLTQRWLTEGKLTPAAAQYAQHLLLQLAEHAPEPEQLIAFSEGAETELPTPIATLIALVNAMPALPVKRTAQFVSVDGLENRRHELLRELQRVGFTVDENASIPDSVLYNLTMNENR